MFYDAKFSGSVDFKDTEFGGNVGSNFKKAKFKGNGDVNFSNSEFFGDRGTDFSNAEFLGKGKIHFFKTVFDEKGQTLFKGTIFSGKTYFIDTEFSGGVNFKIATFKEETNFMIATFSGKTYFRETTFLKEVTFRTAVFLGEVYFDWTKFKEKVDFYEAIFWKNCKVFFEGKIFDDNAIANFQNLHIEEVANLTFDNANLNKVRFLGSDLKKIDFKKVYWNGRKYNSSIYFGRIKVFDEKFQYRGRFLRIFQRWLFLLKNWLFKLKQESEKSEAKNRFRAFLKKVGSKILKFLRISKPVEKEENHYEVYRLYNQLLKNYQDTNRYHEAGDFFAGMMEMRRRESFEKMRIRIALWFYRLFSLYGERPTFVLGWLILLWLFFGLIFLNVGIEKNNDIFTVNPKSNDNGYVIEKVETQKNPIIKRDIFDLNSYKESTFLDDLINASYVSLNNLTLGRVKSPYRLCSTKFSPYIQGLEIIFGAVFISLFILAMNRKFRRTKD